MRTLFITLLFAFTLSGTAAMADSSTQVDEIQITVNVNQASAEELATLLNGIGQSKANAIVMYRDKNGPFKSKEELMKVKGIGNALVAKNDARLRLK
ncbi:ComEA family DNA-binding protein [Vibrio zhugei]|uniref:ComEA family DNA-binding protein n=1 Tax=Vibrio zhugei TaxID=2479546 RepID=A0ABV7C9G6_9VIBR|nr:ComEA family DNA-binding protein [Vibrio zhugei]